MAESSTRPPASDQYRPSSVATEHTDEVSAILSEMGGKRATRVLHTLKTDSDSEPPASPRDVVSAVRRGPLALVDRDTASDATFTNIYWYDEQESTGSGSGAWLHYTESDDSRSDVLRLTARTHSRDRIVTVRDRDTVTSVARSKLTPPHNLTLAPVSEVIDPIESYPRAATDATRKKLCVDGDGHTHVWDSVAEVVFVMDEAGRYAGVNSEVVPDPIAPESPDDYPDTSLWNWLRVAEHTWGVDIDSVSTPAHRDAVRLQRQRDATGDGQ